MEDWGVGSTMIGVAVGLIAGLLSVKQKSWSELSEKEKKIRISLIAIAGVLLVAGIVMLLVY